MNNESRIINSIRNIATGFLGQFIQIILGFFSRTIFIKYLATEYLGISGLFTNILSMLSLAELGVGSAIIYALYKPLAENNKEEITALMSFYKKSYKIIGLVIAIAGLCILPFLKVIIKDTPNIQENIYLIFFFYLFNTVITYFFSYKNSIIVADQKNYISSFINYTIYFFQTILQIVTLVWSKNFLLYLFVQSISIFVYNIIISRKADRMYPYIKNSCSSRLDTKTKNSLISNIKSLMIIKLSGVLVNNTDNMIITYFSGLSSVGLCSNYNMLIGMVNNILSQIFSGITASVGNLNAKEDSKKKEEIFNVINFMNFWMFGFSAICIIILSNDFIKLWLGSDKYVLPIYIPIVLAINFYMVGMQNAVWTYKNTMGIFKQGRYLLLVTSVINLILSMILGRYMGLFGILISTAIARLVTNTWYDPYAIYKYGFKKNCINYFYRYIKFLLIIVLNFVITGYLCNLVNYSPLFTFITKLIICMIVPNTIIVIIFYNSIEFKYIKDIIVSLSNKILCKKNKLKNI